MNSFMKRFRLVIGIVVFGVLMGLRPEFESIWIRSLAAGIAFAVLASCVIPLGKQVTRPPR